MTTTVQDLVLLPGWSLPPALFDSVRRGLPAAVNSHVLCVPMAASLESMARAALAQAPARAAWCGHSLGGMIALQAALLAPERVDALLLLAASPSFVARAGWPQAMAAQTLAEFADGLEGDVKGTLMRFDALQCRGGRDARAELRVLREWRAEQRSGMSVPAPELSGTAAPGAVDAHGLRVGLDALAHADLRAALPQLQLQCPMAWLFAEADALVPAAVAREIRLQLPAARVVTCAAANHLLGLAGDAGAVLAELNALLPANQAPC